MGYQPTAISISLTPSLVTLIMCLRAVLPRSLNCQGSTVSGS
jgi:hypothetical protein